MISKLLKNDKLSVRNVSLFLATIPLAFTLKLDIWVLEIADIFIGILIVLWLFRKRSKIKEKRAWKYFNRIPKAYVVFIVWAIITVVAAWSFTTTDGWINMFLRILKLTIYSCIFWIMITEGINTSNGHRFIFWGYIAGMMINAVLILSGIGNTGSANKIELREESGINQIYESGRRGGLTHYNAAGSVQAAFLVFLIAFMVKKNKYLSWIAIILISFSLLLGQSRGAWVTLIFGLILLFGGTRRKTITLLILLLIGIFAYNSPLVQKRIFTPQVGYYDGGRYAIGLMYLNYSKDMNVFGKGFYGRFYRSDMNPAGSHNQYIQVLYETGIIGLILYLNVFYAIYRLLRKIPAKEDRKRIMALFAVQLFSVMSGEFWYAGNIWSAQIILFVYAFLHCNRDGILEYVNKRPVA